jgi:hypothetical protein
MIPLGLEDVEWALTLWRPWTALMVVGPKNIENRDWPPPRWLIGKRLAIHAGLKFDEPGWQTAQGILRQVGFDPFDGALWQMAQTKGSIVGTAVVAGYVVKDDPRAGVNIDAIPGAFNSPWFFGRYGWLFTERKALPAPVPCRGAMKLWRLPDAVRRAA